MTAVRLLFLLLIVGVGILRAADEPHKLLVTDDQLTGWVAEGVTEFKEGDGSKPNWTAEKGVVRCAGKGFGFLRYDTVYTDFEVKLEYRLLPNSKKMGNSGLGIRTTKFDPKKSTATRPSFASYEIQLLDDAGKPPTAHSSGSLYRYVAPTENAVKAAPEWNSVTIRCVGPKIRVEINGKIVQDVDQRMVEPIKDKPLSGYFCLQCHDTPAEFRQVRVQELK
jgi:hypothetical protein